MFEQGKNPLEPHSVKSRNATFNVPGYLSIQKLVAAGFARLSFTMDIALLRISYETKYYKWSHPS